MNELIYKEAFERLHVHHFKLATYHCNPIMRFFCSEIPKGVKVPETIPIKGKDYPDLIFTPYCGMPNPVSLGLDMAKPTNDLIKEIINLGHFKFNESEFLAYQKTLQKFFKDESHQYFSIVKNSLTQQV